MQEWKASEKEVQKASRDGAISVNLVTGEATRISDREVEQDYSSSQDAVELTGKTLDRVALHGERSAEKKARRKQSKAFREGEAAASRPSSRLQFSEEERAAPELQKVIRKSDKEADKLDAARAAVPSKPPSVAQHANPLSRPMQELGTAVSRTGRQTAS